MAEDINPTWIKVAAKQIDDKINAKFLIYNEMIGEVEGKRKKKKIDFITNIIARSNHKIIFDLTTSPYIAKNSLVKFSVKKDFIEKDIEYIVTDNKGIKRKKHIVIKNSTQSKNTIQTNNNKKSINFRKDYKIIWNMTTPKEVIRELYGLKKMISGTIQVKTPKYSESSNSIPIDIKTNVDLESIVILIDNNPHSVLATLFIPVNKLIKFHIRFKAIDALRIYKDIPDNYQYIKGNNIIVIGKGRDGKIYKTTSYVGYGFPPSTCGGGIDNMQDYLRDKYNQQNAQ